jgi:glycosyltransferase involved in cell wall biosynthesis
MLDHRYKGKLFYIETMDNFTLLRLRLLPLETAGYLRRFLLFVDFIFLCLIFMPRILKITGKVNLVYSIAPIIFSSYIGAIYAKCTKSLFVYEVSDLWPEELVVFRTRFSFVVFSVGRIVAKLSFILPNIIVTISGLAAEHVATIYKPRASICVLPIGVDISKFRAIAKDEARRELIKQKIIPEILQNKFIILYSGLISNATRVENLVYAASKLKDSNDIAFLIIGDGEAKPRLQQIKLNGDIKNLYLLPFQSRTLMPTIISSSDICVVILPSEPIFDVDVPTKFYEYLACHKPQIGICAGELAKIINSNQIGLTVSDGDIDKIVDSIGLLKNSRSLVQSMEKNSHRTLLLFSLDSLASKFAEVLKKETVTEKLR